jgi:GTP-binding protein HflX
VVDISHPFVDEQIEAVNLVLNEIGAGDKPTMMVFNKVDRLNGGDALARLQELYHNSVAISATEGRGIEELLGEIAGQIRPERELLNLKIPHEQSALIARLHKVGQVLERRYTGKMARLKARIPPHFHAEFAQYIVE